MIRNSKLRSITHRNGNSYRNVLVVVLNLVPEKVHTTTEEQRSASWCVVRIIV
jgi:hypothetical protein